MADPDDDIGRLLASTRTIALVGASANPARPSHGVMQYLQAQGYKVIPVNPGLAGQMLLGEMTYAALSDIPEPPDMIDIFRRTDQVGPVVDEAIAIGAKSIWMQLDIVDDEAAGRARKAGLEVVMDRCTAIEIRRRGGRAALSRS